MMGPWDDHRMILEVQMLSRWVPFAKISAFFQGEVEPVLTTHTVGIV